MSVDTHSAPPGMPWFLTYGLLLLVFVAALIRPFAPLGFMEWGARLTGVPASLDLGDGKSVRFVEDTKAGFGCPGGAPYWSPDDTALVMDCDSRLEAWTPAGRLLGSIPSPHRMPLLRVQVLANPLRVIYGTGADASNGLHGALIIWDVTEGKISSQPDAPRPAHGFAGDPTMPRIAVSYHSRRTGVVDVLSLPDWHVQQTIPMQDAIASMNWVPSTQALLLGGIEGSLFRVDVDMGQVDKLASPYFSQLSDGASISSQVKGLSVSPDGTEVAIYMGIGGTRYPKASSLREEKQWHRDLGTGVEIRSIADGHLVARMPGASNFRGTDMVWDRRNRFVAVAGYDALAFWSPYRDAVTFMAHGESGRIVRFSENEAGTLLAVNGQNQLRLFRIEEQSRPR